MKISAFNLQKLGFFQLHQAESEFGTWYKTYDYLGYIIVFDRTLGTFLLLRLADEGSVRSFLRSDIVVFLEYDRTYLLEFYDRERVEAVDLCQWLNVWQVTTFAQIQKAVKMIEQYIEDLYTFEQPAFWYGDRVLYDTGQGTSIGTVVAVNLKDQSYGVLLSGGNTITTTKTTLLKAPVSSLKKMFVSLKKNV